MITMPDDKLITRILDKQIRLENEVRAENHVPSGKLSASMLGAPVQWQILKYLEVEPTPKDRYTLKRFERGRNVEDWLIKRLENEKIVLTDQKKVEYRDCVGYLDILCFGEKFGIDKHFPIEVKSTANSAFKWITKRGGASPGHKLQAGFYGIGLDLPFYSVCYIATDDYRTEHFIYDTDEIKDEVDDIIDLFEEYKAKKVIPVYEEIEKWNSIPKYNSYYSWSHLTEEELKEKAEELYARK